MRKFAAECLRWSEQADNASQPDLMVRIAGWALTARSIENRMAAANRHCAIDLRDKLD